MRCALVLAIALTASVASADPIRLDVTAHGGFLDLTFTNTSSKTVKIDRRIVGAAAPNYDWLTVVIDPDPPAKARRTFTFVMSRKGTGLVATELAPNAAVTESIDLDTWALRDGGPIAPGAYRVSATWDASKSTNTRFVGRATTTTRIGSAVPIQNPPSTSCAATTGVEVLASQIMGTAAVNVGLLNTSTSPICIQALPAACVFSDARVTMTLDPGTSTKRLLQFRDAPACDKTGQSRIIEISPGGTWWERIDLAEWASPGGALPTGSHTVDITYTLTKPSLWHGTVTKHTTVVLP